MLKSSCSRSRGLGPYALDWAEQRRWLDADSRRRSKVSGGLG